MTKKTITQNSDQKEKKRLTGSLIRRVFLVSFIFLVIPLLIYSIFLYKHEYNERRSNLFVSLNILGDNRALIIEQTIDLQKRFLNSFISKNNFIETAYTNSFTEETNVFLKKIADRMNYSELYYLSKENNQLLVQASADKVLLKKFLALTGVFQQAIKETHYAFISNSEELNNNYIYVTKTIYDRQHVSPIGLLVSAFQAKPFINRLADIKDSPYPIDLSFLIEKNQIVLSSNDNFASKEILNLSKIENVSNGFELTKNKMQFFSIVLPIKEANFSLLLDVNQKKISALHKYFYRLGIFLILIFVVGGFLSLLLIVRISKPLKALFNVMKKVSKGDVNARFTKDKMGFEINLLGKYFNEMIEALIVHQKRAETERLQKLSYYQELKIGHDIQKSMFPKDVPQLANVDIAFDCLFAKEVGGDFYDIFMHDKKLVFAIADTAGKGISACLYSLSVRSMLRAFIFSQADLKTTIQQTNNLFCKDTQESSSFVTSWVGIFDPNKNTIEFNSAGHFPALLKKINGEIQELNIKGIALGVEKNMSVKTRSIKIEKGDSLLLYTDGVIEAMDENKQLYGKQRLIQLLKEKKISSSQDLIQTIIQDIKNFSHNEKQSDDITLLSMRFL